jgi:hypothetical protein
MDAPQPEKLSPPQPEKLSLPQALRAELDDLATRQRVLEQLAAPPPVDDVAVIAVRVQCVELRVELLELRAAGALAELDRLRHQADRRRRWWSR